MSLMSDWSGRTRSAGWTGRRGYRRAKCLCGPGWRGRCHPRWVDRDEERGPV